MSGMTAGPPDRALDPLLTRAALVVEGDDVLGRPRHVGDDETDTRVKLARMPFDLGGDTPRFRPASSLIGEVRIGSPNITGEAADGALEQVTDPFLQNPLAGRRMANLIRSASRYSRLAVTKAFVFVMPMFSAGDEKRRK
jgi:hypothetical protein